MWFCGMNDLGSKIKSSGTNTNSGKSTLGSRIGLGSRVESKSKNLILHSFPFNEMWLSKRGDSISKSMNTRINVGLKNGSNLGKDTWLVVKSAFLSWPILEYHHWVIMVLSNSRIWFIKMVDLGSRIKGSGTNTNSGKSSLGLRVSFDSRVVSKSKNWSSHSFSINGMWLSKVVI